MNEPGIDLHSLARRAERAPATVTYHLKILEQGRMVQRKSFQGVNGYFSADGHGVQALALRSETAKTILAAVNESPGCDLQQLTAKAGLSRSTVNYHLRRLEAAGALRYSHEPRLRFWPN